MRGCGRGQPGRAGMVPKSMATAALTRLRACPPPPWRSRGRRNRAECRYRPVVPPPSSLSCVSAASSAHIPGTVPNRGPSMDERPGGNPGLLVRWSRHRAGPFGTAGWRTPARDLRLARHPRPARASAGEDQHHHARALPQERPAGSAAYTRHRAGEQGARPVLQRQADRGSGPESTPPATAQVELTRLKGTCRRHHSVQEGQRCGREREGSPHAGIRTPRRTLRPSPGTPLAMITPVLAGSRPPRAAPRRSAPGVIFGGQLARHDVRPEATGHGVHRRSAARSSRPSNRALSGRPARAATGWNMSAQPRRGLDRRDPAPLGTAGHSDDRTDSRNRTEPSIALRHPEWITQ